MVEENNENAVPAKSPGKPKTPEKKASPEKKKTDELVLEVKKTGKGTSSRPPISEMVDAAIFALNEKGGSSLAAIKKYIAATFKIDTTKSSSYIKRYIIEAVDSEHLLQAKGSGATGSFKLSVEAKKIAERSAGITSKTYLPKKAHKAHKKPEHPPYYQMIDTAVIALNEKYGSSLSAIKKYLAEHYKIDTKKKAVHIRRYVNSALENGQYVQSKGSGASGRVRIAHDENDRKKAASEHKKSAVVKTKKAVKRLGRPKKDEKAAAKKKVVKETKKPKATATKPSKKRGRPSTGTAKPKPVEKKKVVSEKKSAAPVAPKKSEGKRGRPSKSSSKPAVVKKKETKAASPKKAASSGSPKKRGRPSKK